MRSEHVQILLFLSIKSRGVSLEEIDNCILSKIDNLEYVLRIEMQQWVKTYGITWPYRISAEGKITLQAELEKLNMDVMDN